MSRIKKIGLIIFVVVVAITAIITYFVVQINDNLDYLVNMEIVDVDLNQVQDGTYVGEYAVFPVKVIVEVEVNDHQITDITIVEHQNGQGTPAEIIVEDVILEQSLQVDSIAGATYSSKVILLAIRDALLKAI